LVAFGSRTANRPLFPWERELINVLGCSEEEFKWFIIEAAKRGKIRPAEYDAIPDIVNGPGIILFGVALTTSAGALTAAGSIVVSLAIGLVLSGVSFLLAPKPSAAGGGRRIDLASRQGGDRFIQTTGFDSTADLAAYGEGIGLIWTKYTGTTGGVLVTPRLAWSRVFSLGSQQSTKLLYIVGEGGIGTPDLAGIYIGNNGLGLLTPNDYALWWNANGRVQRANLLYGTQGGGATGDPQPQSDLLYTSLGPGAFSAAQTPSNNTSFGISNAVPNATQYRLNFKIVSIPKSSKGKRRVERERQKITGSPDRNGGIGYGYFRRQGIAGFGSKTSINVSVGSTISYIISGNTLPIYFWGGQPEAGNPNDGGGTLEDVNNTLDSECAATDDVLQVGESVIIDGSVWRVTARSIPIWEPGLTQRITLQCSEILESSQIRVQAESTIVSTEGNVNGTGQAATPLPAERFAGAVYDNLARVSLAVIKNTRPCNVTQIGIRSQVWGRFNNLCNFNSLLTGPQIEELEEDNVAVSSGTQSEYFTRTSSFTIYWRELGTSTWTKSNTYFCVRGSNPTTQFQQITVNHQGLRALEFRMVPLTGAFVYKLPPSTQLYWLNASSSFATIGGNGVTFTGQMQGISVEECYRLPQMQNVFEGKPGTTKTSTGPNGVTFLGPTIAYSGYFQVWATHYAGTANSNASKGNTSPSFTLEFKKDIISITVKFVLQVVPDLALGGYRYNNVFASISVVDFTRGILGSTIYEWSQGDTISNQITSTAGLNTGSGFFPAGTAAGVRFEIASIGKTSLVFGSVSPFTRVFEDSTGVAEVSSYGPLITRSCDNGPEHQVVYINEQIGASGALPTYERLATVALSVRSGRNLSNLDQLRVWIGSGINNSNSFPELVQYLLANTNSISNQLIDTASFAQAHSFTQGRKLLFDGAITEKVNLRSYIADLAPFFLLNFVIANGKFALQPAVPSTPTVPISQIFTAGNILDGSFKVEYLSADQRKDFQALMVYRVNLKNQLPTSKTHLARFSDVPSSAPIETFDMSGYCTSRDHAVQVARYFLSIRRRITHAIKFKTAPEGAGISPGSYIKVALEQGVQSSFGNGVISATGQITNATPLGNGSYPIIYFNSGMTDTATTTLVVVNGFTTQSELFGSMFTLSSSRITTGTYLIEQIDLDEDGLVNVSATEFPSELLFQDMNGTGITVTDT
jgi:hypothetical protein